MTVPERGKRVPFTETETETETVFSAEKTLARRAIPGKTAYDVWRHVLETLDRHGFPPPDEKLKVIVGAQIKHLLAGAYPYERVQHFAVELALSWDNAKGHQRLLGLRQRVLQDAAEAQYKESERHKRAESQLPVDPVVRALVAGLVRQKVQEMRRAPKLDTYRCTNCGWQRTNDPCPRCKDLASWGIA